MKIRAIMYSRLQRTPPPRISLADFPIDYMEMESLPRQLRFWKRVAKKGRGK